LDQLPGAKVRVFVVWEPVLPTDMSAPGTMTLERLHDPRAAQFWDHDRMLSHLLGEKDRRTVVWDQIAIYDPGHKWESAPPTPVFAGRTVVRSIGEAKEKLEELLKVRGARSLTVAARSGAAR
jgi:hypothetical protein